MNDETAREDLLRAWEEATRAPDSRTALRAFSELKDRLAKWQTELVRDAVAEGASWDDVGAATGTSRQAAGEISEISRRGWRDRGHARPDRSSQQAG